jgi:hypothetical protein
MDKNAAQVEELILGCCNNTLEVADCMVMRREVDCL